jgi:putative FmdB family regulatory protein
MPTYDYECQACKHRFELFQSIKADPIKKCPECGKLKVKRLLGTGGALIFKGSGFYQTDYRSESYKAGEKSAAPTASNDSASSPASTTGSGTASSESKSSATKSTASDSASSSSSKKTSAA